MIDTIVILFIFYMSFFCGFAEVERQAGIKLPIALVGDSFEKLPNQIVVNMSSSNDVTIDGQSYKLDELPGFFCADFNPRIRT